MADEEEQQTEETIVSWSGITATLIVSVAQTTAFYLFFLYQRSQEKKKNSLSLYEPRQFTRKHRSPAPFGNNWITDAWAVDQDELRKSVGLDTYMYLRFLAVGARIAAMGIFFSVFLIPIYATGENRGDSTIQFNLLTLARVEQGSNRMWATLVFWWLFVAIVLREFWNEWNVFAEHRQEFMAHGDPDGNKDSRYAIRVESLPQTNQTDRTLKDRFEEPHPDKVRQANVFLNIEPLEKNVAERQVAIVQVEKAAAYTKAYPSKPAPKSKVGSKVPCLGRKVDTIEHYSDEITRLNAEIDTMRDGILTEKERADETLEVEEAAADDDDVGDGSHYVPSSSGTVIFTTLYAKQSAMEASYKDIKVLPADDPISILWENVAVPFKRQRLTQLVAACLWTTGILFWAIPVAFVVAIANLDSILKSLSLPQIDTDTAIYGIISGLLPVIFLAILMAVLYMAIVAAGSKFIRYKSAPEVDAYTFFWHMLFQFANLWLILFGGSFFNQVDAIVKDPTSLVDIIAKALPGASVFFVNMVIVKGLGNFGMELSMLPQYGTTLVMKVLAPEAQRTQRMLDDEKTPPEIKWGKLIPHHVFVFLVMIMYQPIVPLMEVFAFVYFGGSYIVWKHQCLHVYAQSTEGGGLTTWQSLFGFLMACLYMGEAVFIAYMGIKKAPGPAGCGFVPLIVTVLFHVYIYRKLIMPNIHLSLEVAANVDKEAGELQRLEGKSLEDKVYGQPALKASQDERGPMPYRREPESEEMVGEVSDSRSGEVMGA
eukprot:scaffold14624_cov100-Cylindrotheca_fusiformis.AAC.1